MDISPKQKFNKETVALNHTLDQMDLTDTFRTFHPKAVEYTLFSIPRGTFSRRDHMLSHKISLNKLKKTEIVSCIFSNHISMKLEITHKKKSGKNTNTWRVNKLLLNDNWV